VRESPRCQAGRPCRVAAGGDELAVPALVPGGCGLVDVVPRKLVDDEQRRERRELVKRRGERIHVVEDSTGDDSVELSYVVELLESDPAIERPFRRMRIDPEDVETRVREIWNDATLVSAPDLQHAQRWKPELREHELSERHGASVGRRRSAAL
jgi:hypothetical protein